MKKPQTKSPAKPSIVERERIFLAERKAKRDLPDPVGVHLIDKHQIEARTGLTFPTIWKMMRSGAFPRSVAVGGRSVWRSDEFEAWIDGLQRRKLKGDPPDQPEAA